MAKIPKPNTVATFKYLLIACKVLGCIFPCIILIALGTWQIFRLKEKLLIIQRSYLKPVILPIYYTNEYYYRKVILHGTFENKYLKVFAGKNGYYLVQPMKIEKNKYILVNRGTLSTDDVTLEASSGAQVIEGTLYCKLGSMTKWVVRNSSQQNLWFWYDIDEMSRYLEIPLEKCIIWENSTVAPSGVKPNTPLKIRNNHLGYAITWYVLALTWICGVFYVRRLHS